LATTLNPERWLPPIAKPDELPPIAKPDERNSYKITSAES
jgi:hypothetical protein